jgi:hypothetical protein
MAFVDQGKSVSRLEEIGMTVLRCQRLTSAVPAAIALALFTSCGGSSPVVPGTPTPATPTVAPTTEPPPPIGAVSCPFGDGTLNTQCSRKKGSALLTDVDNAINAVIQQKPEIFNLDSEANPGSHEFKILDREAYLNGVVTNLRAMGLCAERERDIGEYIHVKDSNEASETFGITLSSGHIRRGSGSYRETCSPASFPIDPGPNAPPPLSGKVHVRVANYHVLDSTAIVGPDGNYCRAIGYKDGRTLCPVRQEGDPERGPCETWRVGTADDTGRAGPTWTRPGGGFCTGPESGCQNHPDNQYQLWVFANGAGTYKVCADNFACGEIVFKP